MCQFSGTGTSEPHVCLCMRMTITGNDQMVSVAFGGGGGCSAVVSFCLTYSLIFYSFILFHRARNVEINNIFGDIIDLYSSMCVCVCVCFCL